MNEDLNNPNTNQPNSTQSHEMPRANQQAWSPVAQAMRHDLSIPRTKQGNPIDPPDPGSAFSRLFAVLITILVVAFVVFWQNSGDDWKYTYLNVTPPAPVELTADQSAPGSFGQVDLMGRFYVRGFTIFGGQSPISMIDNGSTLYSAEDQIRIAMLAGEFEGSDPALERLNALETSIHDKLNTNPDEPLVREQSTNQELSTIEISAEHDLVLAEIAALRTLYTQGFDSLEEHQRDQISTRYGLVGKFALTHGMSDTDPRRQPYVDGSVGLILFVLLVFGIALIIPITGLTLLILGIVYFATGRFQMRHPIPKPGGSVFLETYTIFVVGFIAMSVGTFYVANSSNPDLASFSLLVQWLLLFTILWGLIRGMHTGTWRKAIGCHTGEGVFKEIGVGIVAYLASIPIYIVGVIITMVLLIVSEWVSTSKAIQAGDEIEPQSISNPILEILANGNWLTTLMLFVLATTWAPIVEEAIFRGALFRHLRARMHWVFAGIISALCFAFMHDYGPLMVAPLIALGFMFAFMREWRGSLIAPVTAHFLHNFSLMSIMILLVQIIKDPM